jgi:hypothetical protein
MCSFDSCHCRVSITKSGGMVLSSACLGIRPMWDERKPNPVPVVVMLPDGAPSFSYSQELIPFYERFYSRPTGEGARLCDPLKALLCTSHAFYRSTSIRPNLAKDVR